MECWSDGRLTSFHPEAPSPLAGEGRGEGELLCHPTKLLIMTFIAFVLVIPLLKNEPRKEGG